MSGDSLSPIGESPIYPAYSGWFLAYHSPSQDAALISLSLAVLSPLSASSPGPVVLAPRTPAPFVDHDAASPVGVVTHKEWVVPPRPKVG